MKRIAFVIVVVLTISILVVAVVFRNHYNMVPDEATKLFENNKKEMLSLANKQVDSLFVNGDTNIYPIYFNCKPRYVEGNPWVNSGTSFREILYPTKYEDRLPKDIISTYHFAPENPGYRIGKDIVEGIKMEIKLKNTNKEKKGGIQVDWKGIWQSGWALGVNERWGDGIIQYIIIPYAVSFRKQNYGILGDYLTIESSLESAYKFLTDSPQSVFKGNIVPDINNFVYEPLIHNDYYCLLPKKVDQFIPRTTITESPAYSHYIIDEFSYVFIRALGIKKYELVLQEEHVNYLKDEYIKKERESIKEYDIIVCGGLGIIWGIFLIILIIVSNKKQPSLLQRLKKQSNPRNFIENYDKEKLEIANSIYEKALNINDEDKESIASLIDEAEEKLGIFIVTKREIKELRDRCNPKNFMKPYNADKIAKANNIYGDLQKGRMSYRIFVELRNKVDELYS